MNKKSQVDLKPIVRKEKLIIANPRELYEKIFKRYWYFDSFFSKAILFLMLILSIYAIARIIKQGIW